MATKLRGIRGGQLLLQQRQISNQRARDRANSRFSQDQLREQGLRFFAQESRLSNQFREEADILKNQRASQGRASTVSGALQVGQLGLELNKQGFFDAFKTTPKKIPDPTLIRSVGSPSGLATIPPGALSSSAGGISPGGISGLTPGQSAVSNILAGGSEATAASTTEATAIVTGGGPQTLTTVASPLSFLSIGLVSFGVSQFVLGVSGINKEDMQKRVVVGILAGAASGAAMGSIVPGIGTAIGALVGGIFGGLGAAF